MCASTLGFFTLFLNIEVSFSYLHGKALSQTKLVPQPSTVYIQMVKMVNSRSSFP